ncbi:MAG: spore coat protein [Bacilli bacterium]
MCSLTEKDVLLDVIGGLKSSLNVINTLDIESSSEELLSVSRDVYDEVLNIHRDLFNIANLKGYYSIASETPEKVKESYLKFENGLNTLKK